MKLFLYAGLFLSLSFMALPSYAQKNIDVITFQQSLKALNRLKPLQNPKNISSDKILKSRIADSKNKIIGNLEDILISNDGYISSLLVSFKRLHLANEVYLNYQTLNIKGTKSGYKLDFNEDEVVDIYPNLLANIETASGGQGNITSLSALLGKNIYNDKRQKIAELNSILFDEYRGSIKAAYLSVDYSNIRDKGVAIPYSALNISQENGYVNITIDQDISDIIIDYAKKK